MYLSWIIFDVAIILNWIPYHLLTGVAGSGMESVSIMTFVAVYVNARLLKMSGLAKYFSKKVFVVCCVLFLANVGLKVVTPIGLGYNSPFVMLMAISSLLLFAEHIKLPAFVAKMVLWLSPLMFGVYIMHETPTFGRLIYHIPQQWAATQLHWHPLLIIFITAVICFIVCAFVDLLRRSFVVPLLRPINNLIAMLDARFGFPLHASCSTLRKGDVHD